MSEPTSARDGGDAAPGSGPRRAPNAGHVLSDALAARLRQAIEREGLGPFAVRAVVTEKTIGRAAAGGSVRASTIRLIELALGPTT